jgi:HPt (histidine-containing phosphotransfer) domain-containing protein
VTAAYERHRLIELFGDDPATLAEIERDFLGTAREAVREIAATDDLVAIARAAHRVKGAAGMIGAGRLRDLAEALERAALSNDLPAVRRLHDPYHQEVSHIAEQAGLPPEGP